MANPWHHAISSSRKWGGDPEDYLPLHQWFDATKAHVPDFRHRALRHHSEGIFQLEQVFGAAIDVRVGTRCPGCGESSKGDLTHKKGCKSPINMLEAIFKKVPTRWVGEQHVTEDHGFIPTAADWLRCIAAEDWMSKGARPLSREQEEALWRDAGKEPPPTREQIEERKAKANG